MSQNNQPGFRWRMLALSAATHTFAAAIPWSCLPALFKEISDDLGLSLVQVGVVWGTVSLAGVFSTLLGGLLGDRAGARLTLTLCCVLGGIAGASRGLAGGFASLAVAAFAFGLVRAIIPVNVHKTVATYFQGRYLGMANGVVSMGMGIGLALGPLVSASLLSPLLGGWRNVLLLYGVISVAMGALWWVTGRDRHIVNSGSAALRQTLSRQVRIRGLWLLGLTTMFRLGAMMGMTGYLPLYLRSRGWAPASADATLAVFFGASVLAVMPLAALSDRLGSRKAVLFAALLTAAVGIALLGVVDGAAVWLVVIAVGAFMDGFMAVILTMVQETKGVGPGQAGTALGLVMTMSMAGPFMSPPVGNSLASIGAGVPFFFWAALSVPALVTLTLAAETGRRGRQ